jgi:peptide subunit release factor 1 (eRF1)
METENEKTIGFIIVDGHVCLFGTLKGKEQEVLFKFSPNIPTKMGRGGPSAERFKRRRIEKRKEYLTNISDIGTHLFLMQKGLNIHEIVLCSTRDFQSDLSCSLKSSSKYLMVGRLDLTKQSSYSMKPRNK